MTWIKACGTSSCIEVKFMAAVGWADVIIRNGGSSGSIRATNAEWDAFVAAVKDGQFDRPVTS